MKYLKYVILGLIMGMLFSAVHLEVTGSLNFSYLILKLSFLEYILTANNASYFDKILLCYFPSIVFQVIAGTEIYKHYCTGAVYYFSRCTNRGKWYIKEIGCLILQAIIYMLFYIVGSTLLNSIFNKIIFDFTSFKLMLYFIIIFVLWNYIFSLLTNIAALFLKSSGGFVASMSLQMFFISLYVVFQEKLNKIYEEDIIAQNIARSIPFSHLIISWHSSNESDIDNMINLYHMSFDLNYSVVYLLIFSILISLFGAILVQKTDFICSNKETGG